jgi:hypothetical protein
MHTGKDMRKSRRRAMHYTAWIVTKDGGKQGCALADISTHGARIEVMDGAKVPEKFVLFFSLRGKPRRACHVVWRKERQIGVAFDKQLPKAEATTLAPQADADAPAEKQDEPTVA